MWTHACTHVQGIKVKGTLGKGLHTSKDVQNVLSHIPTDSLKVGELEEVCCAKPLFNLIGSGERRYNNNDKKDPIYWEPTIIRYCSRCFISIISNPHNYPVWPYFMGLETWAQRLCDLLKVTTSMWRRGIHLQAEYHQEFVYLFLSDCLASLYAVLLTIQENPRTLADEMVNSETL